MKNFTVKAVLLKPMWAVMRNEQSSLLGLIQLVASTLVVVVLFHWYNGKL